MDLAGPLAFLRGTFEIEDQRVLLERNRESSIEGGEKRPDRAGDLRVQEPVAQCTFGVAGEYACESPNHQRAGQRSSALTHLRREQTRSQDGSRVLELRV